MEDEVINELIKEYKTKKLLEELGIVKKKPKLGERIIRATFVSTPISALLFIVLYLAMSVINNINGTTVMPAGDAGIFGLIVGLAGGIGIELSKDLE